MSALVVAIVLAGLVALAAACLALAGRRRRRRAVGPGPRERGVESRVAARPDRVDLGTDEGRPDPLAAELLPESVCRHFVMLPISLSAGEVVLAVAESLDPLGLEVARALCPHPIRVVVAPPDQLGRAIERAFGSRPEADDAAAERGVEDPAAALEGRVLAEVERRIDRAAAEQAEEIAALRASLERMREAERRVLAIEERVGRIEARIARTADTVARAADFEQRLRAASREEAEAATRIGEAERRLRGLIDS
jgi:hypothetical protein